MTDYYLRRICVVNLEALCSWKKLLLCSRQRNTSARPCIMLFWLCC